MMNLLFMVLGMASFLIYRKGLQDGMRINKGQDIKPIVITPPKRADTESKKAKERFDKIMSNVENYSGSAEGQVKV